MELSYLYHDAASSLRLAGRSAQSVEQFAVAFVTRDIKSLFRLLKCFLAIALRKAHKRETHMRLSLLFVIPKGLTVGLGGSGKLTGEEFETAKRNLDEAWPQMDTILADEIKAGELAIKHVIRGFDAIHLAAALELRTIEDKAIEVTFCSFDDRQNDAARAEDLRIVELGQQR